MADVVVVAVDVVGISSSHSTAVAEVRLLLVAVASWCSLL